MSELTFGFHLFLLYRWIHSQISQKRKMQATIGEMYGWTKEKTCKTQSPSSEEIHNPQHKN